MTRDLDNVIVLKKFPGNGAREAMLEHILETGCTEADGLAWVDYTLANLWVLGFQVVPVEFKED